MKIDEQFVPAHELEKVVSVVGDRLKEVMGQGFGFCKITVETVNGKRRQVRVETAKSDQFVLPGNVPADPNTP